MLPSFEVLPSLPETPGLPVTAYSGASPSPLAGVKELPSMGAPVANQVSSLSSETHTIFVLMRLMT